MTKEEKIDALFEYYWEVDCYDYDYCHKEEYKSWFNIGFNSSEEDFESYNVEGDEEE